MADVAAILQTMRALREPQPPAPVLPYLVMLACGLAGGAILAATAFGAARRVAGARRSALALLASSRHLAPGERLAAQASLLRRLVRSLDGDAASREQGATWLRTLDRTFATRFFTQEQGRAFGEDLYRPSADTRLADRVDVIDRSLGALIRRVRA